MKILRYTRLAFKLATSNLIFNWGISLLTLGILAAVFLNLAFVPALLSGFSRTVEQQLIDGIQGDIAIYPQEGQKYINRGEQKREDARDNTGVSGATVLTKIPSELEYEGNNGAFQLNSIDPQSFSEVFTIPENIVAGRFLEEGDQGKIVLGAQIAPQGDESSELYPLSLKTVDVGDEVTVKLSSGVEFEYEVVGIFEMGYVEADLRAFVTDTDSQILQTGLAANPTSIHLKVDQESSSIDRVEQDLKAQFPGLQVYQWKELAGMVDSITSSFGLIQTILMSIGLFVSVFTVYVITQIDITSKRRQIGILRALGIPETVIVTNYLLRALLLNLLAVGMGSLLLYFVVAPYITANPIEFPFGESVLDIDEIILLYTALVILVAGVLSALLPSLVAVSRDITCEIRQV